jgi:hypothetical protein
MVSDDQGAALSADDRGPGQFTVGTRFAGEAHLETFESLQASVPDKLKQHAGLVDLLVVVLDLSSPIIEARDIAAMLYGRMTATMPTRDAAPAASTGV